MGFLSRQEILDNTYRIFVVEKSASSFCEREVKSKYILGQTRCPIGHMLEESQCHLLDRLNFPLRRIWEMRPHELNKFNLHSIFSVFHRNDIDLLCKIQVKYDLAASEAHIYDFHQRFGNGLNQIREAFSLKTYRPRKVIVSPQMRTKKLVGID